MIFRLGCLFILVPIVELALLIRLGQGIGLWPTLGLLAGTGILGGLLAKREGLRVLIAVQSEMARGRVPAKELMDGAAVLLGGALLLTPGILTDLAGLALLLPGTRRIFTAWARRRIERAVLQGTLRVGVWGAGPVPPPGAPGAGDPDAARRRSGAGGRSGEIIQE